MVPSAPDFYLKCGEAQFQGERKGLWVKHKRLWVRRKGLWVKDTADDTGTRVARLVAHTELWIFNLLLLANQNRYANEVLNMCIW